MAKQILMAAMLIVFSYSKIFNQNSDVARINRIIEQTYHEDNKIPRYVLSLADSSFIFNSTFPQGIQLKIPIKKIVAINTLYKNEGSWVTLYIGSSDNEYVERYYIILNQKDSANTVVSLFFNLCKERGLCTPARTCVAYENDFQAIKFETIKKTRKGVNNIICWGIDSDLSGQVTFKYPDSKVRFIRNLKDGIYNGQQKEYYPNGHVQFTGNYLKGLPEGRFCYYDNLGMLVKEETYHKGLLSGIAQEWWPNKVIKSKKKFNEGILVEQEFWDMNGITVTNNK